MAATSAVVAKMFGQCFSCHGKREFTPTETKRAQNNSTDIHVGPCFSCGKRVSTISKRSIVQTADSNNDNSVIVENKASKRSKKQKVQEPAKAEEQKAEPKVAEVKEVQEPKIDSVSEQKQ